MDSCNRVPSVLNATDERLSINSPFSNSSIMYRVLIFFHSSMLYYLKRILYGGGGENCEEIHYSPNENILKYISFGQRVIMHPFSSVRYRVNYNWHAVVGQCFANFWSLIIMPKWFKCHLYVSTIKKKNHDVRSWHVIRGPVQWKGFIPTVKIPGTAV